MSEERTSKNIVWTIERQLKAYTENSEKMDRHEILWHAWKHNKQWLSQLQEWIMPSYPTYSKHDESHSLSVLHNIEMMLGEENIRKLSASDCFLLLHVVYIHDVGMCITHEDRKSLTSDPQFIAFLKEVRANGDRSMKKYADLLLTYCKEMPDLDSDDAVLNIKLEIYYAILYLIPEYKRSQHGKASRDMLEKWIDDPEKLGIGFSTSGVPSRFFHTIAACAATHTCYDFNEILKLCRADGGFANDYIHPRFAAVLLQLGDALDLDNNRFHPLVKEFMGTIPHTSEIHFDKHHSIRRLRISPEKISIEANCELPEALRQINLECETIKEILKQATFHWSVIRPSNLNMVLPDFEAVNLLVKGERIPANLINAKFQIQQKKAFHLLQGSNIYEKEPYVFLREIFQNALDTSKLQYWIDWKGSRWFQKKANKESQADIVEMGQKLSPLAYPIEVEFHLARREKYGRNYDYDLLDEERDSYESTDLVGNKYVYGVLVRMIDHGVGMTAETIQAIADLGSSYSQDPLKREIEEMSEWLLPTAEFGIGLQSIFLVADFFKVYTHPRTNDKYEIVFEATGDKGKGIINVTPLNSKEKEEIQRQYGSTVEVFVPWEEKWKRRDEDPEKEDQEDEEEFWLTRDPFEDNREEMTELYNARNLSFHLIGYLNSLVGEMLFPIKVRLYEFDESWRKLFRDEFTEKNLRVEWEIYDKEERYYSAEDSDMALISDEIGNERAELIWSYGFGKDKDEDKFYGSVKVMNDDYQYMLDCQKVKLYLWDKRNHTYARFGADRIQALRKKAKLLKVVKKHLYTKIYYKGVYVTAEDLGEDIDFLEYIDIKGKMDEKFLAISRNDFTKDGYRYIQDQIYPNILKAARKALKDCEKEGDEKEKKKCVIDRIKEKLTEWIKDPKMEVDEMQQAILSAIGMAVFGQIRSGSDYLGPSHQEKFEKWSKFLMNLGKWIEDNKKRDEEWKTSTLFNFTAYELEGEDFTIGHQSEMNIAEIMNPNNKFAIISKREKKGRTWEEYLLYLNALEIQKIKLNESKPYFLEEWVDEIKKEWDEKKREDILEKIESWGDSIKDTFLNWFKESIIREKKAMLLNQNYVLNWMLKKLPSIAMFSDKEATIRINVLSLEYTDSIYFDRFSRWNIYQRMLEDYKKRAESRSEKKFRFSTIAMTGYCQLAVETEHPDIFFVKRGKISRLGQRYMIMPVTGSQLDKLFELVKEWDLSNKEGKAWIKFQKEYRLFIRYIDHVKSRIKKWTKKEEQDWQEGDQKKFEQAIEKYSDILSIANQKFWGVFDKFFSEKGKEVIEKQDEEIKEELKEISIKELTEEKLDELMFYTLNVLNEEEKKETETWIKEKLLPYHSDGFKRNLIGDEDKDRMKEEMLEECGFKDGHFVGEEFSRIQRLIQYVEREGWIKLSKERYLRLYEFLVKNIIDDIITIASEEAQKQFEAKFR